MSMPAKPKKQDTTATAINWPREQQGATGEDVRTVQYLLNEQGATVGVDGTFGRLTTEAVRAFQAGHDLSEDGIVGNLTWTKLATQIAFGSTGHAVRAAQRQINRRCGRIAVDGVFLGKTDAAVRSFQGTVGLGVDGIVEQQTWNALVSEYLTSDDGQAASLAVFTAWTKNDRDAARKNATNEAVDALFSREWNASDAWALEGCDFINGRFRCTWSRAGEKLVLDANDNVDAPFYFVDTVTFQSPP
jgi:hypothetical protein